MKTLGIIVAGLLTMICSVSFAQTPNASSTTAAGRVSPEVQAKLDLISQNQGLSEWEQQQIANGATYVYLQNGEKAFFATTPAPDSSNVIPTRAPLTVPDNKNKNTNTLPEPK